MARGDEIAPRHSGFVFPRISAAFGTTARFASRTSRRLHSRRGNDDRTMRYACEMPREQTKIATGSLTIVCATRQATR